MKALLVKFLLGRGMGKVSELASKAVRHGLGVAGGWLMAHEYATTDQLVTLEGGALALTAIGLSVARTFVAKYAN